MYILSIPNKASMRCGSFLPPPFWCAAIVQKYDRKMKPQSSLHFLHTVNNQLDTMGDRSKFVIVRNIIILNQCKCSEFLKLVEIFCYFLYVVLLFCYVQTKTPTILLARRGSFASLFPKLLYAFYTPPPKTRARVKLGEKRQC